MSTVLLEKRAAIAIVTLNRPEQMNALSRELRRDFAAAFDTIRADPAIRVVVLTGAGKAFCAGFDLRELGSGDSTNAAEEADNQIARAMAEFPGPIIGAINGHAVTGGFELALACDVLIASEHARFADTHGRVGILPGWGLSQKLPRLVGVSRAKEICFTGAPVFAQQAWEWGLVNHVVAADELMSRAMKLAEDMCASVPGVLPQYKRLIDEGLSMPLDEALAWEERLAIESARQVSAQAIESRRNSVLERGRREKQ